MIKRLAISCTMGAIAVSQAAGQCQSARLVAGDTVAANENYGAAIAMGPGVLVVGAKGARFVAGTQGAAYVYRKNAGVWAFESRLTSTPTAFNQFGAAVAIDGDVIAVGAPGENAVGVQSGAAYVFRKAGGVWAQEARLVMPDAMAGDRAGLSIAVSGNFVVVGVPFKSDVAVQLGTAYVFERVGGVWSSGVRLNPNDGNDAALVGSGVACAPDGMVVVGAINRNAVYTFRKSGQSWVRDPKLTPADAAPGDAFGTFVSLSGTGLLVGAFNVDGPAGVDQGAGYVFRAGAGNVWNQEAKLLAKDAAPGDLLGSAGSISGNAVVLGAYHVTVGNVAVAGAAYSYRKVGGGWTQTARVQASDPHDGDSFGVGAATDGSDAAMGSQFLDGAQQNSGAAYVYSLGVCACYANCDASTNPPVLNINDFQCFLNAYALQNPYANCDGSTAVPALNVNDFQCYLNKFAVGCT